MYKILLLMSAGYLIGSVPFGIIIGKLFKGVDIRDAGSGNIGAANAFRILGPKAGIFVLICDILKGSAPVFMAGYFIDSNYLHIAQALTGLSSIIGHNYSVFIGFKGGKGIATSLGVFLCLSWQASLIAVLIYAVIIYATKISSLGSLIGSLSLPVSIFLLKQPYEYLIFGIAAVMFAFYTHRQNLARLIKGDELKIKR